MPSGRKRFFVHCQHRGERVWKIVGDFGAVNVNEARSRAAEMVAAIGRGGSAPSRPVEALFEAVAEIVFRRYERVWKPRTLKVNRCYLKNQILPHFAGRDIAEIDRRDVRNRFVSLSATPVVADRSMPMLSVIMREAEAMGFRPEDSDPCRGVRRYRRKGRERFLSNDEIRRLSAVLTAHADDRPGQVAAVRLLLLTGCRKSEILTLRWSDYREGHLFLRDRRQAPGPSGYPSPRTGHRRRIRQSAACWQRQPVVARVLPRAVMRPLAIAEAASLGGLSPCQPLHAQFIRALVAFARLDDMRLGSHGTLGRAVLLRAAGCVERAPARGIRAQLRSELLVTHTDHERLDRLQRRIRTRRRLPDRCHALPVRVEDVNSRIVLPPLCAMDPAPHSARCPDRILEAFSHQIPPPARLPRRR